VSTRPDGTFSFGWNAEHGEFVLWRRGDRFPREFISLRDALELAGTVRRVAERIARDAATMGEHT
jgi:hypothetical protein